MEHLSTTYQMKSPGVTTTDKQGRNRTLYLPNVSSIEERTRPNLKKTLKGTTNSRPDADDVVLLEVVVAPAASCLAPGGGPHPPPLVLLSTLDVAGVVVVVVYLVYTIFIIYKWSRSVKNKERSRPKTEFLAPVFLP